MRLMEKQRKVVILGAGHVGSHCAYALAQSGVCEEIVLVDKDADKAAAQAMDVADSISFAPGDVIVRGGDYADCAEADVVVISIGEPRKPGQTRLDLLDSSIAMLDVLLQDLKDVKISGIVVTITNPADVVADYVRKGLHMDRSRVFGTGTLLDTARLIRVLSEETGVSRRSIQAFSMGEHGDSSMIPFSAIRIGGLGIDAYDISREKVLTATRQAGMTIIEGKKSTEFGIGRALCEMVACILRDEKKILPASVYLQGEYGQEGVHCGVPCLIGKNGIEKVIEVPMDQQEKELFAASCAIIRQHIEKGSRAHRTE